MGQPGTKVGALAKLGITRQMLYRHVTPKPGAHRTRSSSPA